MTPYRPIRFWPPAPPAAVWSWSQPALFHQGWHVFVDIPDQVFVEIVEVIFPDADHELGGAEEKVVPLGDAEDQAFFGHLSASMLGQGASSMSRRVGNTGHRFGHHGQRCGDFAPLRARRGA
jgi:hypothetical protein